MKRRSIAALLLVTVVAAAVAATTSGATKKANASSITVWLQTDAQSGWADLVASVNQKFQSDHPGTTVNIQYQNWGDHLQKFDATLAGGGVELRAARVARRDPQVMIISVRHFDSGVGLSPVG